MLLQKAWPLLLCFYVLHSTQLKAVEQFADLYLGEFQCADYSGPWDPLCIYEVSKQNGELADDKFKEYFSLNIIDIDLSTFDLWMKKNLLQANMCPWDEFVTHHDYIRYLYRLITMSYIYEYFSDKNLPTHSENNKCMSTWPKLLDSCQPHSEDMKKFIYRAKVYLKNEKNHTPVNSCLKDIQLFTSLCNEVDEIFGVTDVPELTVVLKNSNAFSVVNRHGHGQGCLDLFGQIYHDREYPMNNYALKMKRVYNHLTRGKNIAYKEGGLFLPGSLKVFDDKGLQDFLFSSPTPVPTPRPNLVVAPQPTAETPKNIVAIATATPTPDLKLMFTPTPTPTPIVVLSSFEEAVKKLDSLKLDFVDLDMDKLKTEFILSDEKANVLRELLEDFQTREGLTDMKTYDQLGSFLVPIRLLFVKFLIENNEHQGLYNIKSIIGDRFYLINDLEHKEIPKVAELISPDQGQKKNWTIRLRKQLIDPTPIPQILPSSKNKKHLKIANQESKKDEKEVPVSKVTLSKEEQRLKAKRERKQRFKDLLESLKNRPDEVPKAFVPKGQKQ